MDDSGYDRREVASLFGVSPEAVRLAGIDGRLPTVNLRPHSRRALWRYPKAQIDALVERGWPAGRRGPAPGRQDLIRAERTSRRLAREFEEERVGRALAEQRIAVLEREVTRLKAMLRVAIDADGG